MRIPQHAKGCIESTQECIKSSQLKFEIEIARRVRWFGFDHFAELAGRPVTRLTVCQEAKASKHKN